MANSLAALKSLPCPAGDKCTAFQCLFKHDTDIDSAVTVVSSGQVVAPTPAASDLTQDLPRKRVKLDSVRAAPSQQSATRQIESEQTTPERPQIKRQKVAMSSRDEPARSGKIESPLPVVRKLPSLVKGTGQSQSSSSQAQDSRSNSTSPSTTPARTIAKPKAPTKAIPKKPEVLNPRLLKSSPAQHDTRLKLVKALHEQYVRLNSELKKDARDDASKKLLLSEQELIVKTLDDEQEMAIKKYKIYGNAIRNRILACKRMTAAKWKEERLEATKDTDGQETEDASSAPKVIVTGLTTAQEIDFLHRLVSPLEGLTDFGYVASIPSDEDIQKARESVTASGNVEVCDRCTRRFQVFPGRREEDGALASNGTCTFHPGKTYFGERGPGKLSKPSKKYRCCHLNVDDDSGGCTTAPTHVFKTTDPNRLASLLNFAETPPNPQVPADRAVGFDCEMGFTTYGLELIRMTLVSWPDGEKLLDVLVQPYGEILDLNTRYSGVTPEDMVMAERWKRGDDHKPTSTPSTDSTKPSEQKEKLKLVPSPQAARDLLFSMISPDTPLIGHGLENDLNSVRIIHPTCVDTVLLYPHRRGLPIRNGLRMLMDTLLNRKIQRETDDDQPEGHDSAEDARAAGELARLKVRDEWCDLMWKGWAIKDGEIVPPEF
ncbi:hypothetical protein F4820DRAFT_338786 [Hypoxylon rubiginosum]|uniref:Uncharacterized protein n=1 Tax=Hypoxylon rubiginosum TaxID=110542 RepID=A0ACB9YYN0_9PEZI|nr:hypothetical protein F4820DRAFT_338786 [Hypoxylon rubiginosum]